MSEGGAGAELPAGPGGWHLAPEGAVIHLGARVAVVADVHLGYEWARGVGGDVVPEHSRAETIGKLERLLNRVDGGVDRLVVAGDLVERPTIVCPRTRADVAALAGWLAGRGIRLERVRGNHDGPGRGFEDEVIVAGWRIAHGDRPAPADRPTITGHVHPVLRVGGMSWPCFLTGSSGIVLPAFTPNAAGWNVANGESLPSEVGLRADEVRCFVSSGETILDFGLLSELPGRLRGQGQQAARGRK